MKLTLTKMYLDTSEEIYPWELRLWLRNQIKFHGEPLRWAVTEVVHSPESASSRRFKVEVVLITS